MPRGVYERKPWMRNVKKYSKEKVVELVDRGFSLREVAAAVGISKAQVSNVLNERKFARCP
jgi:predicted transcriptional regulator